MHKPFNIELFIENILELLPCSSAEEISAFLTQKGHRYEVRTIQKLMRRVRQQRISNDKVEWKDSIKQVIAISATINVNQVK